MSDISIREASLNDLPILHEFLQGIVSAERPMDECLKDEHIVYYDPADFINDAQSLLLIAEVNQQAVGCGAAIIKPSRDYYKHKQHLYLAMMYVSPEHRGKGINGTVMEGLIAWGKQNNVTTCMLTVYPDNPGAIRAYEKLGFERSLLEMRLR
ncbi:MAG: GNAT family N-acetyltransferase [Glaciecola sp.]